MNKEKFTELGEALEYLGELSARLNGYDRGLALLARSRIWAVIERAAKRSAESLADMGDRI